jgi:hypothetical protein
MHDDIPEFLIIPQAERNAAWLANPPKPMQHTPTQTETERLYYQSIAREKAAKRALDQQRFALLRERASAEAAERAAVQARIKKA